MTLITLQFYSSKKHQISKLNDKVQLNTLFTLFIEYALKDLTSMESFIKHWKSIKTSYIIKTLTSIIIFTE